VSVIHSIPLNLVSSAFYSVLQSFLLHPGLDDPYSVNLDLFLLAILDATTTESNAELLVLLPYVDVVRRSVIM
jgi:hypothetical protein